MEPAMWKTGIFRALGGFLSALFLSIAVVGCGGGGGGAGVDPGPPPPGGGGGDIYDVTGVYARPGPIVAVLVGDTATLDGSRSYTSSPFVPISGYSWAFTHKPIGSTAALQDATTANPSFVADVKGVYTVQLEVSAKGITSPRQVGIVVVTDLNERPTGPYNHSGLSSHCVNCHSGDIPLASKPGSNIPGKSVTHFAASKACQACHTPQGFTIIPFVDHQEVFGKCSECHNGTIAIGMSEFHTPTNGECDNCHNTTSFLNLAPDGTFDHSNIARSCSGCHNDTIAIGKPVGHIVTNTECGDCHNTTAFLPAYPDHTGSDVVGKRCDSCHGVAGPALGQPLGHPDMAVDCGACHNITTFNLGGVFNHALLDAITQPCGTCHADGNAIFFGVTVPFSKGDAVPAHVATTADCNNCHTTTVFAGAFPDHTLPPYSIDRCDSCHDGVTATGADARVDALGIPNHMPIPLGDDCSACHIPGTFATGTYDHAGVTSGCPVCHDNRISMGRTVNHIPTNDVPTVQDCADCHDTTRFSPTNWGHVGIDPSNCSLCHDGFIATGKTRGHVPTVLDCSSCHDATNTVDINGTPYKTFLGAVFNHAGIDPNNCAQCHATGVGGAMTKAASLVPHIPAPEECSLCHDSTVSFLSNTFLNGEHLATTVGCEGCHQAKFFPTRPTHYKSATHLPTGQDCYACHFNTGGFVPAIRPMPHTGINSNCASCHDGTAAFAAVGATPKTANHVPTVSDCGACHNSTSPLSFLGAFVDHATAPEVLNNRCDSCHDGFIAIGMDAKPNHVTTSADCDQCHTAGGAFRPAQFDHTGIVNGCAACHDGVQATGPSAAHPPYDPATQDCSLCHNTTAFAGAKYNHTGIVDNCSRCHDGVTAPGKIPPPGHVPTNQDCYVCHRTTGFIPATFSHAGITGNCSSCHDAGFATPKPATHVPTLEDCGVCHNTNTFVGAVYDHTGIVDNCDTCHVADGSGTAIGQNIGQTPPHLTTALDCHFCHTPGTFKGGGWVHDASAAGNCDNCHVPGGGASTVKGPTHINTTVQCDVCHNTTSFVPDIFTHDPKGDYPGDHRVNLTCSSCHGNTIAMPFVWDYPQYAPYCAACHANDFRSESDHNGGRSGTVEQNKNCGASGCHRITSSGF